MSQDQAKAIVLDSTIRGQNPPSDPNIDMITQSLMIDDTDVKRILKGEIHEPLNQFRQCITSLSATVIECVKLQSVDREQGVELLFQVQQAQVIMAKIELQLTRYYHMVPYLLMTSPLTQLSNVDQKRIDSYCRKVGLMIGRDKLMSSWDETGYESQNFYDAVQMIIELGLHGSVNGWKMRELVEEKKQVFAEFHDRSSAQRKKRFGII